MKELYSTNDYIDSLMQSSFEHWNDDQRNGYLEACIVIKRHIEAQKRIDNLLAQLFAFAAIICIIAAGSLSYSAFEFERETKTTYLFAGLYSLIESVYFLILFSLIKAK